MNAYTIGFDAALLKPLQAIFNSSLSERLHSEDYAYLYEGVKQIDTHITHDQLSFHVLSYETEPLIWISNNNEQTYELFRNFIVESKILDELKPLIDHEKRIQVYCGFFVVGKHMKTKTWHHDYDDGANGYTLITPLFELSTSHGNLLYKDSAESVHTYRYRMNEAIIFGDGFEHATEPYSETSELRVMLSLTFGTDKVKYWDILKNTIGGQSDYMVLPCGHEKGHCECLPVTE